MKSISIIHLSTAPGGIEITMPEVIRRTPGFNFSVFVLRPNKPGIFNVYDSCNLNPLYGHESNIKAAIKLWKFARLNRDSIFHVFDIGPYFLFVLSLAEIRNLVYSLRGTIYWKNSWQKLFRKIFWHLSIKKRFVFIANSEYSRKVFHKIIKQDLVIRVVYNPFNTERFLPVGRKGADAGKKIIYAGRLDAGKNIECWLHVAAAIHMNYPEYKFEIYGEGTLKPELQKKSRELGLSNILTFRGFVKDIERVYQQSDLFIFLSEYESFGNAVVECILCGTPVIVSDIPSMREIFIDFPDFVVPLNENLENNILDKIGKLDKMTALAKKACEGFRNRFPFDAHLKKMDCIYKDFL